MRLVEKAATRAAGYQSHHDVAVLGRGARRSTWWYGLTSTPTVTPDSTDPSMWPRGCSATSGARSRQSASRTGPCLEINSFAHAAQEIVALEEFALKLRADKAVQQGADLMMVAHTQVLSAGCGVSEALDRVATCAEARAVAILIHRKRRPDWSSPRRGSGTYRSSPCPPRIRRFRRKVLWHQLIMCVYATTRASVSGIRNALATLGQRGRAAAWRELRRWGTRPASKGCRCPSWSRHDFGGHAESPGAAVPSTRRSTLSSPTGVSRPNARRATSP